MNAHRTGINALHYLTLHQRKRWYNLLVNRNFFLKIMEVLCWLEMSRKVEGFEMQDGEGDEELVLQHDSASFALAMDGAS